ncbi:MAG TPA: phage capsid protein [Calidithermus sp.]|nr:phage capsid protein [Calidithermus sp.]
MALQNEQWFHHAVSENVTQLAQQKRTVVMGAVRTREGVVGKTFPFHRIGKVDMVAAVRDSDTTYANPPQSKRRAVLQDFSLAVLIDEFDEIKMLPNPQSEFAQILAYARNRKLDDLVIGVGPTALGGAIGLATVVDEPTESATTSALPTSQVIADGGTNLTLAKVKQAKFLMDDADVDPEDRYLFYSPAGIRKLLDDTQLTSSDFNTVKALVDGGLPPDQTFLGFKWRMSTRLFKTGNIRSCIALQKQGVGLAVGLIKEVEIDKAVHKNNNTQVLIKLSAGAVRIDDACVVRIDIDETA